jgi:capsular exopolysaccharide synthesis family protein
MNERPAVQSQLQVQTAKTILRRYRSMGLLITTCVMTAVVLYSSQMNPVYKGCASVLIENKSSTILSSVQQTVDFSRDLALAQKALALSKPVIERAAESANIASWNLPDYDEDPLAPLNEKSANARIEGQLLILEVLNTDPERAALLANAWMNAFVDEMARRQRSASAYASGFLDNQLPTLKKDWTSKQTALQNFVIETNFDRKEAEYHPIYKQYIDLNSKITETHIKLATLKSEATAWDNAQRKLEVLFQLPRARNNQNILAYEKLIQDKRREIIELRQNFDTQGDKVKRAEAALTDLETLCRKELETAGEQLKLEILIEENALSKMEALFQGFKAEYLKVKSHEARYQTLAFEVQLAQSQYEEMMKRQRDASVEGDANYSYAQPWERAEIPRKKYRPNWALNLALGMFLSIFFSASMIGIRELINERVRTATELKRLGHPVSVEIPRMNRRAGRNALSVVDAHPHSSAAQALRILRSNILAGCRLPLSAKKSLVVMVTSAGRSEGKSFIAANLGLLFANTGAHAASSGARVLLIDADMSTQRLSRELNTSNHGGLSVLQERSMSLQELVCPTNLQGLDLIPAGTLYESNSDLFASSAFAQLLQEARRKYDFIIVDSPPLVCGSGILDMSDATIAVVRSQTSRMNDVERMSTTLSQASNVFFVLNAVSRINAEMPLAGINAPFTKKIYELKPQATRTAANS